MHDEREQSDAGPAAPDAVVHHESVRARRGRREVRIGQLNLTPMIDVIFQLLIFFVITAGFMVNEGVLSAKLPQGPGTPADPMQLPPQEIIIRITSGEGETDVVINTGTDEAPVLYDSFGQLAAELDRLRVDPEIGQLGLYDADNPIVIQPNGYARWQHVVNAFNAVVTARYTNVRFADQVAE